MRTLSKRRGGSSLALALVLSGLLAVLHLSASLYMLVVYDLVLPSGSVTDLAVMTALVMVLHAGFTFLDWIRARVMCRVALGLVKILDGAMRQALRAKDSRRGLALLDDVERVRRFLISAGPCAAFDALWLPLFLAAVFLVHPVLGLFACLGTLLLAGTSIVADGRERETGQRIVRARHDRYALAGGLHEDGVSRHGSGCPDAILCWSALSRSYSELTLAAQVHVLRSVALAKGLRLVLQSAGVGLGALLVIEGVLSPGALFASSLMLGRTFACLDCGLAHWRGLVVARESYLRLAAAGR